MKVKTQTCAVVVLLVGRWDFAKKREPGNKTCAQLFFISNTHESMYRTTINNNFLATTNEDRFQTQHADGSSRSPIALAGES
jgi:hypothetical protein